MYIGLQPDSLHLDMVGVGGSNPSAPTNFPRVTAVVTTNRLILEQVTNTVKTVHPVIVLVHSG